MHKVHIIFHVEPMYPNEKALCGRYPVTFLRLRFVPNSLKSLEAEGYHNICKQCASKLEK